ncbi:MAG: hypothetical protein O2930_02185 [Acidobacteria bacterium]|nr:hypothetical protein [Acidobacteriota bacterium]
MDAPQREPGSVKATYTIVTDAERFVAGLALTAFALLLVHSVITIYHYQIEELEWIPWRQLFDVDEENNLPTWFSGFLLGVTSFWLWVAATAKRAASNRWWIHWKSLALGFLVLCIDEVAGLHESFNTVTDTSWAIPGGILAVAVGLLFFSFLWSLPAATRTVFVLAGGIYVGGAVGVEMVGAPMDADTMTYNLTTVVEEGMEMAGVLLFLLALLRYLAREQGASHAVSVRVEVPDTPPA